MFRVPKLQTQVKLSGMDGSVTRGALFVDPASPRHGGQQTLLERLNGPETFVVLEVGDAGQIEIFQKRHLLRVTPTGEEPMDHVFVPDGLVTRQEDVVLTLTNGSTMHGRIWMGLPHDRSRLSDFLNMGEEFFPLLIPGGIHLVRTDAVVISAYVICGVLTAVSAIFFAMYTRSISPSSHGNFYELYAIAASVLGGFSLRGGEGSIVGVVLGTILLQVLQNLVNLLGIPSSLNFAVMGSVILIGVLADTQFAEFRKRRAAARPVVETPGSQG